MTKKKSQLNKLIHKANTQLSKLRKKKPKHERNELSNSIETEFQLRCLALRRPGTYRRPLYWDYSDGDDSLHMDSTDEAIYEEEPFSKDKEDGGWDELVERLSELSKLEMSIVTDRYIEDKTTKEIARKNNINQRSVYKILERVRKKLGKKR